MVVTVLVQCLLQYSFSACVYYRTSSVFVVVTASVQCLWVLQHQFNVCGCYSISFVCYISFVFVAALILCLRFHGCGTVSRGHDC